MEEPSRKLPYIQMYTADWFRDTRGLSAEAKGVWADTCFYLHDHEENRGTLTQTHEEWSRMWGVPLERVRPLAEELRQVGDVIVRAKTITISCRRIKRDEAKRQAAKDRQRAHRAGDDVQAFAASGLSAREAPPTAPGCTRSMPRAQPVTALSRPCHAPVTDRDQRLEVRDKKDQEQDPAFKQSLGRPSRARARAAPAAAGTRAPQAASVGHGGAFLDGPDLAHAGRLRGDGGRRGAGIPQVAGVAPGGMGGSGKRRGGESGPLEVVIAQEVARGCPPAIAEAWRLELGRRAGVSNPGGWLRSMLRRRRQPPGWAVDAAKLALRAVTPQVPGPFAALARAWAVRCAPPAPAPSWRDKLREGAEAAKARLRRLLPLYRGAQRAQALKLLKCGAVG